MIRNKFNVIMMIKTYYTSLSRDYLVDDLSRASYNTGALGKPHGVPQSNLFVIFYDENLDKYRKQTLTFS